MADAPRQGSRSASGTPPTGQANASWISEPPQAPSRRDADEPLSAGERVGRYVIERVIGAGGMGVVYAARDPDLDRRVALKRLRGDFGGGETRQNLLLREARAMARLSHPNVVAVHDVVLHDGQLFIAMELIAGVSLADWLASEPGLSRRRIVQAFLEAGRGLAAAHAVGLVHRDFKPANVLRDRSGRVAVTDFGIARATTEAPEEGDAAKTRIAFGTPAYMSPEQHRLEEADARSDQFSFCVALYEALYKEHPFAAPGDGGPEATTTGVPYAEIVLRGKLRNPPGPPA
jgi:serine/threonine protein kinase